LNILRKGAVARGSECAPDAAAWIRHRIAHRAGGSVVNRQRRRDAAAVGAGRINVAIGIRGISCELLRSRGEGAAQHRLVNEIDSELERMVMHDVAEIVAELILVLIAQVGEKRDGSSKLIVAEGLEAGDG